MRIPWYGEDRWWPPRRREGGSPGTNLYPTPAQAHVLRQWIGCQRLIYNAKVQEDRYFRHFQQRRVGTAGIDVPVDQEDSRFITNHPAFRRDVPSQVWRNATVLFRPAYARFFQKGGGRPKRKKKTGRQTLWLTRELFQFHPVASPETGEVVAYHLQVGTAKRPVGLLRYGAHRAHAVPASIHIAHDGGRWWLAFGADAPTVTIPDRDADTATDRIADALRHLSAEQLLPRTLGGDRGGRQALRHLGWMRVWAPAGAPAPYSPAPRGHPMATHGESAGAGVPESAQGRAPCGQGPTG